MSRIRPGWVRGRLLGALSRRHPRRSRTGIARRLSDGDAGASSGKKRSTWSSSVNFPSAIPKPTAVDVKLLLNEYITCGADASYGDHQPSATTRPCRTIMTLFMPSIALSAAATKRRIAAEEMPSRSGVLRTEPRRRWDAGACAATWLIAARTTSTPRSCVDWKAGTPQNAARRTRQQLLDVGANKSAQSAARVEREVAFRPRIV